MYIHIHIHTHALYLHISILDIMGVFRSPLLGAPSLQAYVSLFSIIYISVNIYIYIYIYLVSLAAGHFYMGI